MLPHVFSETPLDFSGVFFVVVVSELVVSLDELVLLVSFLLSVVFSVLLSVLLSVVLLSVELFDVELSVEFEDVELLSVDELFLSDPSV